VAASPWAFLALAAQEGHSSSSDRAFIPSAWLTTTREVANPPQRAQRGPRADSFLDLSFFLESLFPPDSSVSSESSVSSPPLNGGASSLSPSSSSPGGKPPSSSSP